METTQQAVQYDNMHRSFWPCRDITLAERLYNDYDTLYKMLITEKGVMSVTGINELTARIISKKFFSPAVIDNLSAPQAGTYTNNVTILSNIIGQDSWWSGTWNMWLCDDTRLTYMVLEKNMYEWYKESKSTDMQVHSKYPNYNCYRYLQKNCIRPKKNTKTDTYKISNAVLNIVLCEGFVNAFEIARCIRNELLFYWRLSIFYKPDITQHILKIQAQ